MTVAVSEAVLMTMARVESGPPEPGLRSAARTCAAEPAERSPVAARDADQVTADELRQRQFATR